MDGVLTWALVWPVVMAGAISCGLTYLARTWAPRLGFVDKPDRNRKLHSRPTPLLGGAAICVSMCGIVLVFGGLFGNRNLALMLNPTGLGMLGSAVLFCLLGMIDDKIPLRPRWKFLGQILASMPFAFTCRSIESIQLLGFDIYLGVAGFGFIVFWIVACSNVVNLVDGLDGLAGTVGFIAAATLAVLALMCQRVEVAVVSLILAASIAGFLVHNWPPAKIFLGDSGSLMIGFMLGALSIESSLKKAAGFTMVAPLVLISIPIFDTFMAIIRRKLTGRGIGEADRAHIHHRLQDRGLSKQQALLALSMLCVGMAIAAMAAAYWRNDLIAAGICLSILVLLVSGRVFGHHETSLFLGHLRAISLLLVDSKQTLGSRFLSAQFANAPADQRHQYWDKVCRRVGEMGGYRLELVCQRETDDTVLLSKQWQGDGISEPQQAEWRFHLSRPIDDNLRSTLVAYGTNHGAAGAGRLDDLFRLFDSFLQHWPITEETSPQATAGDEQIIPFPVPQPVSAEAQKAA